MYAVAILLSSLTLGILHMVTAPPRLSVSNRIRVQEGLRLVGLVIVWGVVANGLISLLLPSPWS